MLFRIDFAVPEALKRLYRDLPFVMTAFRWWLFWDEMKTNIFTKVQGRVPCMTVKNLLLTVCYHRLQLVVYYCSPVDRRSLTV